jgi:hypothetical protein
VTKTVRLRRLCELRRIEELNQATLLESARAELLAIDQALESTRLQKRAGRALVHQGIRTGETRDRVTGFHEIARSTCVSNSLLKLKHLVEERVVSIQRQFAAKRAERCQVKTLLESELNREIDAELRRNQASLDEWHRSLRFGAAKDLEDGRSAQPART